jgi:hypothetical protein
MECNGMQWKAMEQDRTGQDRRRFFIIARQQGV